MRLTAQEKCALIERNLRIEKSCMRPNDSGDDRICCLVHQLWLEKICTIGDGRADDLTPPRHPGSAHEQQLVLQPSHPGPAQPWLRISVSVLQKPVGQVRISNSCQRDAISDSLTIAEHWKTIGLLNHIHSCETATSQYTHATDFSLPHGTPQETEEDSMRQTLNKVYGVDVTELFTGTESTLNQAKDPDGVSDILGQNVIPFVCALESADEFFLIEPYFQHSLNDVVMFSPAVLSQSNVRTLFVVYQLLRALNWYHTQGMPLISIDLHHVKMHRGLWLYLQRDEWNIPLDRSSSTELLEEGTVSSSTSGNGKDTQVSESEEDLSCLVTLWVKGCISNFDYLTALNRFAGRHSGDPNYHPVFPWVTDFTDPNGGYRDLRKSKYRLNKGDRQLDVMYKLAHHDNQDPSGVTSVPHHVSDVLSDITYHVYLARRTSKVVLCEHVRTQWVPNEYPSSMARLYQWTPDECIPQYFSDPSIFASIHTDLPDLELPAWTATPSDFVQWHREVLECEAVSKNLHHWIDLTFGHKLSGKAAVKAKNVCLHLTDKHQHIINHGVVQLFTEPHPSKSTSPSQFGFAGLLKSENLPEPNIAGEEGGTQIGNPGPSSPSDSKSQFEDSLMSIESRAESVTIGLANVLNVPHESSRSVPLVGEDADISVEGQIILPKNYNPLELLQRFEAVQKFSNQFGRILGGGEESKYTYKSETSDVAFKRLVRLDMECLGCLLVEMLIPEKSRLITSGLKQPEKKKVLVDLCTANPKILPRFVRSGVLALLNAGQDSNGHLPPPTADLLLHPHTGLFPFPSYFIPLHEFLAKFYYEDLQGSTPREGLDTSTSARLNCSLREEQECSTVQVNWAAQILPSLLPKLDDEGIDLLFYHLQPLFVCRETRLRAFVQLFDQLAQALGPKATVATFTKPLMKIFDSYSLEEYEHLVSQSFLSQIIVRFGLENFLNHFVNSVVDAVAFKSLIEKPDILVADRTAGGEPADHHEAVAKEDEPDAGSQDISSYSNEDDNHVISISMDGFEPDDEISGRVSLMPSPKAEECEDDVFEESPTDGQVTKEETAFSFIHDSQARQQRLATKAVDGQPNMQTEGGKEEKVDVQMSGEEETMADGTTERDDEAAKPCGEAVERVPAAAETEGEAVKLGGQIVGQTQTATETEHEVGKPGEELVGQVQTAEDEMDERNAETTEASDLTDGGAVEEFAVAETNAQGKEIGNQAIETGNHAEAVREAVETVEDDSEDDKGDDDSDDDFPSFVEDGDEEDEKYVDEKREEQDGNLADFTSDSANRTTSFTEGRSSRNCDIPPFFRSSSADAPLNENEQLRMRDELTPGLISGIAVDSVVWLAPRLGPVLTSKYIASQLLRLLGHCYIGEVAFDEDKQYLNDKNAKWVLYGLGKLCALYGDAFMLYQFLPHAERTVKGIKNRITAKGEGAMAGTLALLKFCLPYMSQDSLVDNFETFFHSVFQPVFRIMSSRTLSFPGGPVAREALCYSYVDLLTALCKKLGRELARDLMTAPLQQFFSCFELVHLKKKELRLGEVSFIGVTDEGVSAQTDEDVFEDKEHSKPNVPGTGGEVGTDHIDAMYKASVFDELYHTFSARMAHHAFVDNCAIMGGKHMEGALPNYALIWNLCCKHDPTLGDQEGADGNHEGTTEAVKTDNEVEEERAKEEDVDGGEKKPDEPTPVCELKGKDVSEEAVRAEVGTEVREVETEGEGTFRLRGKTRAQMWFATRKMTKTEDLKDGSTEANSSSDQYLRGSWLEHWRHQLDSKNKIEYSLSKQQVKLQTFTGHSGPVRSLHVQDSEHFFLSSSKDKTVKLWSLSNHGDGTAQSASSWTYYRHSRTVFAVTVVESLRRAASCDGSVHLWDPVSGSCLGVLETSRSNPVIAMTSMPAPSQCVVAAMLEGTARFLDLRQSRFAQEWKVTTSSVGGSVRDICSSPDGRWIALGFSSGLVSVLDVRGGLLRSQRRAHTSDVLQVKAFSNNSFVTSSYDQGLFLWKDDGHRLKTLRGQTDPLNSLAIVRDQILSTSTTNRVGVHNLQEDNSEVNYTSCKVGGDLLKGNITCMSYLPLNQLLLLGSDTSNIVLLA